MAEESAELRKYMAEQRERIDHNMHELGSQIDTATDWKTYVRRHPWWTLGGAFGAGILLSGFAGSNNSIPGGSHVTRQAGMFAQRVDSLFGAAVGVASDVVENAVMDAFPSLRSRYTRPE